MVKKGILFAFVMFAMCFIFICINAFFVSATANLSVKLTGTINNYSSDFYFKVDSNSNNGVDVYDMLSPSDPGSDVPVLYSSVDGNNIAIDSDSEKNRTVNLTYTLPESQSGILSFSWASLSGSGYNGSFVYYGADDSYSSPITTYNMRDYSSYTGTVDGETDIYVRIIINTQNEGSAVDNTNTDNANTASPGGGGNTGSTSPTPSSESNPSVGAVSGSVSGQIFAGESYVASVNLKNSFSVRKQVKLSIDFNPKGMFSLEESEIYIDPGKEKPMRIKITPLPGVEPGTYTAVVLVKSGDKEEKVNVIVEIPAIETKLLDVKADPISPRVNVEDGLKLNLNFANLGNTPVETRLEIQLIDTETGEVVATIEKTVSVTENLNTIENIDLPPELRGGKYLIQGNAYYTSLGRDVKASFFSYVTIKEPLIDSSGFFGKVKYYVIKFSINVKEFFLIGLDKTKSFVASAYVKFKAISPKVKSNILYSFIGIIALVILIVLFFLVKMIIKKRK